MPDFKVQSILNAPYVPCATVYAQGRLFVSTGGAISDIDTRVSTSGRTFVSGTSYIKAFDIDVDGNLLAALDQGGNLLVFNTSTGKKVQQKNVKRPRKVKIISNANVNGIHIAVLCEELIEIWQMSSSKSLGSMMRAFVDKGTFTSFAGKNQLGWFMAHGSNLQQLYWYAESEGYQSMSFGEYFTPVALAFSDETNAIGVNHDGTLLLWSLAQVNIDGFIHLSKLTRHQKLIVDDKVECAAFNTTATHLAAVSPSGILKLFETRSAEQVEKHIFGFRIQHCCFDTMTDCLALIGRERVVVWESGSESFKLDIRNEAASVNCVSLSLEGNNLVTGSHSGIINLWNIRASLCVATFIEHKSVVSSVKHLQSGNVFVSAGYDGTVRAYDTVRLRSFRVFTSPFDSRFNEVAIDESGEIVCASAIDSCQILLWSFKSAQLLDVLSGHTGVISSLRFSTGFIVSGSWDNTVRVWDMERSEHNCQLLPHTREVLAVAVAPGKRQLVAAVMGQQLLIWNFQNNQTLGSADYSRDTLGDRGVSANFVSLQYNSSETLLFASSSDANLCVYDSHDFVLLKKYTSQPSASLSTQNNVGQLVYSAGSDTWGLIAEEGVHIYKYEGENGNHGRTHLSEDTSLSNVLGAWQRKDFNSVIHSAILLSKNTSLLMAVLYNTPIQEQKVFLCGHSGVVTQDFLTVCKELLSVSEHLEYFLMIILKVISTSHDSETDTKQLKQLSIEIDRKQGGLGRTTSTNLGTLNFLCTAKNFTRAVLPRTITTFSEQSTLSFLS